MIPEYFRPILWSHDFDHLDPVHHRKTLVSAAINYGDLLHWQWLISHYGKAGVRATLESLPQSGLRPQAAHLASLVFNVREYAYASRNPHA